MKSSRNARRHTAKQTNILNLTPYCRERARAFSRSRPVANICLKTGSATSQIPPKVISLYWTWERRGSHRSSLISSKSVKAKPQTLMAGHLLLSANFSCTFYIDTMRKVLSFLPTPMPQEREHTAENTLLEQNHLTFKKTKLKTHVIYWRLQTSSELCQQDCRAYKENPCHTVILPTCSLAELTIIQNAPQSYWFF